MPKKGPAERKRDKSLEEHGVTPEQLLILAWNGLVNKTLQAKDEWQAITGGLKHTPLVKLPLDLQKHLSKFSPNMSFETFLDLFIGYARGSGGLEALLVDQQFKLFNNTKEKEQDNG